MSRPIPSTCRGEPAGPPPPDAPGAHVMTSMLNLSWLPPIFAEASERVTSSLGGLSGGATVWLPATRVGRSRQTVLITRPIPNLNPHPAQLAAHPKRNPAAKRGGRAPPDRRPLGGRKGTPPAAFSLSRQQGADGGPGLAGPPRRHQRDRHRGPLRARRHHRQVSE